MVASGAILVALVFAILFLKYFTWQSISDDEGYFLVSNNGVANGHRLYNEVFAFYGPAYYLLAALPLRALRLDWTIEAARWSMVFLTVCAAALMGVSVRRVTRVTSFGVATFAFTALAIGGQSPLHPAYLLLTLASLAVFGCTEVDRSPDSRLGPALIGVAVGAALLTKINVGILLAAAVFFAAGPLTSAVAETVRRWTPLLVAVAFLTLAARAGTVTNDLLLCMPAIALFSFVTRTQRPTGPRLLMGRVAGPLVGVFLVCVGAFVVAGSSLSAMFRGIVLEPLSGVNALVVEQPVKKETLAWLVAICVAAYIAKRASRFLPEARFVVAALVLANVAAQALPLALPWDTLVAATTLVALIARTPSSVNRMTSRCLASISVLLPLTIYPVAGFGPRDTTLLAIPAFAFVAISDSIRLAASESALGPTRTPLLQRRLTAAVGATAIAFAVLFSVTLLDRFRATWTSMTPVAASSLVRDVPDESASLRAMTGHLRANCSNFFSIPGLNSFYARTGWSPPTQINAGSWMFFEADRQAAIVDDLRTVEGLCVLRNAERERVWLSNLDEKPGPLRPFLDGATVFIARSGNYELYRFPK